MNYNKKNHRIKCWLIIFFLRSSISLCHPPTCNFCRVLRACQWGFYEPRMQWKVLRIKGSYQEWNRLTSTSCHQDFGWWKKGATSSGRTQFWRNWFHLLIEDDGGVDGGQVFVKNNKNNLWDFVVAKRIFCEKHYITVLCGLCRYLQNESNFEDIIVLVSSVLNGTYIIFYIILLQI